MSETLPYIVSICAALLSYLASRHQYNIELKKVKEHSLFEIEKIKTDMDAQAELYERNKQTDYISLLIEKFLNGDDQIIERLERLSKIEQSGTFKNNNHPAVNKRKK